MNYRDGNELCTHYVFIGLPEDRPMPTARPARRSQPEALPLRGVQLQPSKLIEAQASRDWVLSLLGID